MDPTTPFDVFRLMCPMKYICETLIPATNTYIQGNPLTFGEFLRWLGLMFVVSGHSKYNRQDFWSTKAQDAVFHPPNFSHLMSLNRFTDIIQALTLDFAENSPIEYVDPMWEVRKLYDEFNEHMAVVFSPSHELCLDESMVAWTSDNAPNWMCVKRKPHPFGNEIHTIACASTRVIFRAELKETKKHRPSQLPLPEFEASHGKTPTLVLRLTRSVWGSGRIVNMDSGFGVLKTLTALLEKGLYGTVILKKKRYWPTGCPGDYIKSKLTDAQPGTTLIKKCTNHNLYLLAYREAKFICLSAHTYGTTALTTRVRRRRTEDGTAVGLRYPLPLHDYYVARHAVDDNNNYRMARLGLEKGWQSKSWKKRHLSFILSLADVNSFLMYSYLAKSNANMPELTHRKFREALERTLINNQWLAASGPQTRTAPTVPQVRQHVLVKAPPPTRGKL
eukprot:m.154492 g.154492  ORF g.154492 m.154492 type:complete len:447 (-) comp16257_c0_seq9:1945-3285(-)